ncbi:MAG: UDP-N-acetylglucosamine 2-epimerase (non-hydrolyzing) [Candidatus Carbobacillus altaicus]|uniref:UDP-N-acetylglucosamine 2-epimerase (non-hydrolyzing) n=1 Tax=Candidatus Carbonibacillus altaicus TaxID=2163959 RepID=A0A2R6Y3Z9_9BACL|nr:UDP-N-acetylglucosamine 2-epimerase (non-hydrolyzing) [Candidatus Carbobacillus altaicus]PTQ57409.1 MAG: UDP-N-acetylglucosamine 2-epimerase [Candidatus Carbobacillus altaicus]
MKDVRTVLVVFGTRPEAIKMAPLVLELKKHTDWQVRVAVTAQHREMLDQVLDVFQIRPDYDLNIMKKQQTLVDITSRVLSGLRAVMLETEPAMVLVHGDTTTTFAAALAAFYQKIPIGHVEAGLRTYDKYAPYPEEMNRQLTGVLADLHFAPTDVAKEALLGEGKRDENIFVTGNTVIDALTTTVREDFTHPLLDQVRGARYILLTAHRRENWGEPLRRIFQAVKTLLSRHPDVHVIYPVHPNPEVKETAEALLGEEPRAHLTEPLEMVAFHNLMARSTLILSDSGGVQEEAPALGKPVLVLREVTERPEGVRAGTLLLVGTDEARIVAETERLLGDQEAYLKMARAKNPYGDGQASRRIREALAYYFGERTDPPEAFRS